MSKRTLSLDFNVDERGVSPVIGVILMVAITVILAAVIGAFVLNLGSNLGSTGPQTQLAANCELVSGSNYQIVVEHKGGDSLQLGDVSQSVTDSSGSDVSGSWSSTSGTFSVGSSLNFDNSGSNLASDTTYNVQFVHNPSQSILLDTEVTC